ncbi:MAG: signal peptidase [Verrucomicrobiota bacterium]|jgi:signal peptidase I|nr:signal peptidase [Verrucomicrobiota bacterium]
MKFLKIRKARKNLKEALQYAKRIRHMYEDIADPEKIQELRKREQDARQARRGEDTAHMAAAGDALIKICKKTAPPRRNKKIRENVEVLFVAIAAAMAIRTYIFQPFKIPTGSMQPTLYGITIQKEPVIKSDNPLASVLNFVLFGERYRVIRAKAEGMIRTEMGADGLPHLYGQTNSDETSTLYIGNVPHRIPNKLIPFCRFGAYLHKGDPMVQGIVKSGDYILVNRFKYNFVRPKRGDIAVFDTRALTHPQVRKDAYYIKRIVGLPGETLSVDPKYLLVNGKRPVDPRFNKIFTHPDYNGYQFAQPTSPPPLIGKPGDSITLAGDEYLFFGDNTDQSLDGRYFGAVNRRQILGPAFFVCWPLDRAGIAEISH